MSANEPVKVCFHLEVDESGYPPVSSEYLWAVPTRRGSYIVDNIPFYAREISMGDEFSASMSDGSLTFKSVVKPSSNSTIRVFVKKKQEQERIASGLKKFGCRTEIMEATPLIAASLPLGCKLADALAFLDSEVESGTVAIEESAVRYQTGGGNRAVNWRNILLSLISSRGETL